MSRANVAGLHDTATMTGISLAASALDCAWAPWRGGSNSTASKPSRSSFTKGFWNKSRRATSIGLRPAVTAAAGRAVVAELFYDDVAAELQAPGEPSRRTRITGKTVTLRSGR